MRSRVMRREEEGYFGCDLAVLLKPLDEFVFNRGQNRLLTQYYILVTHQQQTQVLQHLVPSLPCCCFILRQDTVFGY